VYKGEGVGRRKRIQGKKKGGVGSGGEKGTCSLLRILFLFPHHLPFTRLLCRLNPLELHDNKTVRLTEFFEGLEISSVTNILCRRNIVANMTV